MDDQETRVLRSLERLLEAIKGQLASASDHTPFQPRDKHYLRTRTGEFKYGPKGVERQTFQFEQGTRKSFDVAASFLFGIIEKTHEYVVAFEECKSLWCRTWDVSNGFRFFVLKLCSTVLSEPDMGEDHMAALLCTYIKEVKGELLPHKVEAQITGIVVSDGPVGFEIKGLTFELRQIQARDLEEEVEIESAPWRALMPGEGLSQTPSAVLTLSTLAKDGNEIHKEAWKAIAMLRLFCLASVEEVRSRVEAPTFSDRSSEGVSSYCRPPFCGSEVFQVGNADVGRLKEFWEKLAGKIPQELYWSPGDVAYTHQGIAYKRYSEALAHDALIERRIANAVMGLEALFLRQQDELSYRLRVSVAKLLDSLGNCPQEVHDAVNVAYSVRSAFVHGDQLSPKKKRRLGDLKSLATNTLDYLRQALVLSLVWQTDKDRFVEAIEGALVDPEQDAILRKQISPLRGIIVATNAQSPLG
jgi:hypothetical protein